MPGRHGVGEDGRSALDEIISPPRPDINKYALRKFAVIFYCHRHSEGIKSRA